MYAPRPPQTPHRLCLSSLSAAAAAAATSAGLGLRVLLCALKFKCPRPMMMVKHLPDAEYPPFADRETECLYRAEVGEGKLDLWGDNIVHYTSTVLTSVRDEQQQQQEYLDREPPPACLKWIFTCGKQTYTGNINIERSIDPKNGIR